MIRRPPRPTPFPNPTLFRSRSEERPYAHDPRADGAAPLEPDVQFVPRFMDPIGLALDNFDVTAKWRERENGMPLDTQGTDRKSTRLNSSHLVISYAVFCLTK